MICLHQQQVARGPTTALHRHGDVQMHRCKDKHWFSDTVRSGYSASQPGKSYGSPTMGALGPC